MNRVPGSSTDSSAQQKAKDDARFHYQRSILPSQARNKETLGPGILPIEIGPGHCGGSAMQSMLWLLFLPLQESRGSSDETEQELTDGQ
jgi:hypothetical protein